MLPLLMQDGRNRDSQGSSPGDIKDKRKGNAMETKELMYKSILNDAEQFGKEALVDPIPEIANEESLPHRAETMRVYFTARVQDLMSQFEALPKEIQGGTSYHQMREKIVDSLEKGFETLMHSQPAYHHCKGLQHELSETVALSQEVFQTIRNPHTPYPERLRFEGGRIEYRLSAERGFSPERSFASM